MKSKSIINYNIEHLISHNEELVAFVRYWDSGNFETTNLVSGKDVLELEQEIKNSIKNIKSNIKI